MYVILKSITLHFEQINSLKIDDDVECYSTTDICQ